MELQPIGVVHAMFKENVPDVRNAWVADVAWELEDYGCAVAVYDPLVSAEDRRALGLPFLESDPFEAEEVYDAVILAVAHRVFLDRGWPAVRRLLTADGAGVFVDLKSMWRKAAREDEVRYWGL